MGTEVYPFRDMQVVDYGDIPCNPFNMPKVGIIHHIPVSCLSQKAVYSCVELS